MLNTGDVEIGGLIDSASDPLLCKAELQFERTYFPLGFPVKIATNSEAVLEAADESWKHFKPSFQRTALHLKVAISGEDKNAILKPPVYRSQDNLLSIIADADNFAVCDLNTGFAFSWLTPSVVQDRAYIRYFFLEAAVMCLLSSSYLTSVHAACVELQGCGILLCGDSGAGKSSLAFACASSGWSYISDDASYIVQGSRNRIVLGNSHQIRFRPSASYLFPELQDLGITPRATGKPSIEVSTRLLNPDIITVTETQVRFIVFLNREKSCVPDLVPFPKEVAQIRLQPSLFGTKEIQDKQADALQALLSSEVGVYELFYSDLNWAVSRLETLAKEKR
jgi:HPr serine kinase-like protein